jgi:hypothetical protein
MVRNPDHKRPGVGKPRKALSRGFAPCHHPPVPKGVSVRTSILSAALIAIFAPLPAMAQDWHRVMTNPLATQYVDLASIKPVGGELFANEVTVFRTTLGDTNAKYIVTTAHYDCKRRRVLFQSFEAFDENRVSLEKSAGPDKDYIEATPDSPAASALDFVCNTNRGGAVRVADPMKDKP